VVKVVKSRGEGLVPYEFDPKRLALAYRGLALEIVMDLHELCFADRPTFDPDPRRDAYHQGMRAVWLHINNHLRLDPEQIELIYQGRGKPILTEEEANDG
jgi:hypothetical protein